MKTSRKRQSFFCQYLDELTDACHMLSKEGMSEGERKYRETMGVILLFIENDLRIIRTILCSGLGLFAGLLLCALIGEFQ